MTAMDRDPHRLGDERMNSTHNYEQLIEIFDGCLLMILIPI